LAVGAASSDMIGNRPSGSPNALDSPAAVADYPVRQPAKLRCRVVPAVVLINQRVRNGWRLNALARLVTDTPELRDAFAALLGGIRLSATSDTGRSILVTSTQPNEGKTTVASCLAITASLAGQTVLLIDGDLRRRRLGAAAGIADDVGLGEILEGQAEPDEAIHTIELFEDEPEAGLFSFMSAGRKSPAFLPAVDWPKARTSFRLFAQRFGIVFLDSPPILAANDALLLGGIVDGVLLVVGAGSADRDEVRRAKAQLEPIGAPVIGAVLNQFDPKQHGRSNQPYRGYYLHPRR
jgi:capsular exopolysaccharide synthesis family protein